MTAKEEVEKLSKRAEVNPDEPVFVLVARDITAPKAVRAWANWAEERFAVSPELIEEARELARQMLLWQRSHGTKTPD